MLFVLLASAASVAAQTVRTEFITGTVTDESGSALPGVTITVTSPALQVPQLVDTQTTRGGGTVTQEIPQSVPNNRNYQDIMSLTPGMVTETAEKAGSLRARRSLRAIVVTAAARLGLER